MVEWVKRSTLRWFGHIKRMGNEEFVKKVGRWGRPQLSWLEQVDESCQELLRMGRGPAWRLAGETLGFGVVG